MNDTIRPTPAALILFATFLLSGLNATPAAAMGRSGAPTRNADAVSQRLADTQVEQQRARAELESQIKGLHKELDDLKSQLRQPHTAAP